ncbi:MAG: hypothetical protein U1E73_01480 [Planctomycetota bacterium]
MFRFLRWLMVLVGGLLLGAGLTLHGHVAVSRYMRKEVDKTFVLWRAIGRATFYFQGGETRMALAMREVPEEALDQADRAAWVLVGIGALLAVTGPFVRHRHHGKGQRQIRG